MKKENTPNTHPIDAFFREQEGQLPVSFDPAHWDALQQQLDQAATEAPVAPGMHVSDQTHPSIPRLFGLLLILGLLALVPAAAPADLQKTEAVSPGLSSSDELPGDAALSPALGTDTTVWQSTRVIVPAQLSATARNQSTVAPLSMSRAQSLTGVDTVMSQRQPAFPRPDSLSRRPDSLSLRKIAPAAVDSTEQKRKKKHLFW